ncbi:MAG: acyltransferase [Chthoniobacteraceae bacterium]|jgi:peptidoglycan/LPS O-acetylase OafA/YrhL
MRDIKAHTGLRGIAAMAVFLGHAEFDRLWHGAFWLSGIYSFFYWQNPAVDLFFMLSGFILNYVYIKGRRATWRTYFSARFARICPLYYAGLVAVLAMNVVSAHFGHLTSASHDFKPSVLLPNLAMVQEWPVPGFVGSINVPSWSISVEFFLYIFVFPLLAWILSRRRLSRTASIAILVVAALIDGAANRGESPFPFNIQYTGLLRGITGFTAGFLICELVFNREESAISWPAEIGLVIVTLALLPFPVLHVFLPLPFAALIAVTFLPKSRLGRLLGSPPFHYLGGLSYSIYIWQYPVLKASTLAFGLRQMGASSTGGESESMSFDHKLLYCAGTCFALVVVANVSYYWFESPLRRILRRPIRTWFTVQSVPQSAGL